MKEKLILQLSYKSLRGIIVEKDILAKKEARSTKLETLRELINEKCSYSEIKNYLTESKEELK